MPVLMSNIGWHRVDIQKHATIEDKPEVEKIQFIPALKVKASSTDSEKESVRLWNLMQATLLKHDLMQDK